MTTRYRRADFLSDAEWLGLDLRETPSDADLRKRRDELMLIHHPDRGGSVEMASRVNETYARMQRWLLRRKAREEERRRRRSVSGRETEEDLTLAASRSIFATGVMTSALGAVAAWMLITAKRR